MEGPQKENGYTPLAHKLLEDIGQYGLNGTQRAIIDQVWRYTYGFKRKKAELSLSFLSKALKKTKSHVDRELTALIDRNVIRASFDEPGKGRFLSFNKYFGTWLPRPTRERKARKIEDETPPKPPSGKKPKKPKEYGPDNTFFKMANYFLKKVNAMAQQGGLTHLAPNVNLQNWANDFRLLYETDQQQDKDLIKAVMDWVVTDEFWRKNVLSAKKFRKHFPALVLQLPDDSKGPRKKRRGDSEADARDWQIRRDEALRKWMDDGRDPSDFQFDG